MRKVYIDFETRSHCDLAKTGAQRYAEDESTEVLLVHWECDGEEGYWEPDPREHNGEYQDDMDLSLCDLADDDDTIFVAHNVGFEQAILIHPR